MKPPSTLKRGKIYIAGPMTGMPELNLPLFAATNATLTKRGWDVVDPTLIEEEPTEATGPGVLALYLRDDMVQMVTCDAIVMLPGWQDSVGANCELLVAQILGLESFTWTRDGNLLWSRKLVVRLDLVTTHIHDTRGNYDEHLPVGEGKTDWKRFIAALADDAPLVLEIRPVALAADAERALAVSQSRLMEAMAEC